METASIIISASSTMLALGMLIVTLVSYRKRRNRKLVVLSIMFLVFLVKGVLLSVGLLVPQFSSHEPVLSYIYSGWFDLVILLLLFLATVKR